MKRMNTKRVILSTVSLVITILMLCMMLPSCGNKQVEKLTVTEGLATQYELNSTPDFSKVKATVTFNDGTTKEVDATSLTFGSLDTKTPGKKDLTVSYGDFTITVEVEVKGATIGGGDNTGNNNGGNTDNNGGNTDDNNGGNNGDNNGGNNGGDQKPEVNYEVMGVSLPTSIAAFKTNAKRFKDQSATYVVGDDNPFTFRLVLMILDENDNIVNNVTNYKSTSTVHLVEETKQTLVDATYVTIDEDNNTFDFTEAAIGKTFIITTRPLYGVEDIEDNCTRTLTVVVKDGYNVTSAKELNLMTNETIRMHERYKTEAERDLAENRQNALAKAFIDQQYGVGYYDTYGADKIKGIIFHSDLAPQIADIPADYVVYNSVTGTPGVDNGFAIYNHIMNNGEFSIYGNYFTLNTSGLPMMSDDPAITDRVSSNSGVFYISGDGWSDRGNFNYNNYVTYIENLAMRDVNANENIPENSPKRMHGLNGIEVRYNDVTIKNTIIEAYTISIVPSNCSMELNIDQCIFDNAWQNHIYLWTHNYLQCYGTEDTDPVRDQEPWANVSPIALNITNSKLTKCGGPVILAQKDGCGGAHNTTAGVIVTVDKASELWSYVTGQEAWFAAYNSTAAATQLISLDSAFVGNAAGYAGYGFNASATFLTTQEGTGETKFMNLVFLNMDGANSKYIIVDGNNENTLLDASDTDIQSAVASNPYNPVFKTTEGGTAQFDSTANYAIEDLSGNPIMPDQAALDSVFKGDHIALYTFGMGIVMGYYH